MYLFYLKNNKILISTNISDNNVFREIQLHKNQYYSGKFRTYM